MTEPAYQFRNVILCDDVRDEVGNKKSLMGILGGDVVVAEIPASIWLAVYIEYWAGGDVMEPVNIELRLLQDETQIAKATINVPLITAAKHATLILPRALVTFEKEVTFRICASVNGEPETEILTKQVMKGPIS